MIWFFERCDPTGLRKGKEYVPRYFNWKLDNRFSKEMLDTVLSTIQVNAIKTELRCEIDHKNEEIIMDNGCNLELLVIRVEEKKAKRKKRGVEVSSNSLEVPSVREDNDRVQSLNYFEDEAQEGGSDQDVPQETSTQGSADQDVSQKTTTQGVSGGVVLRETSTQEITEDTPDTIEESMDARPHLSEELMNEDPNVTEEMKKHNTKTTQETSDNPIATNETMKDDQDATKERNEHHSHVTGSTTEYYAASSEEELDTVASTIN